LECGVHCDRLCAEQWVLVAGSSAVVRRAVPDRASPLQSMDQGWTVAQPPPRGPGRARQPGVAGLVPGDLGRSECAGEKRGSLTGPSPVDRGKSGSKIHVLSDRGGLPLSVAVSAANTNDSFALKPLVMAIPAIKGTAGIREKPAKWSGSAW
jgi:hypothetical protein